MATSGYAVATFRSNQCWIASTLTLCFSCAQLCPVQRLIFATADAIGGLGGEPEPVVPSRELRNFALIYARCIGMPTPSHIQHYCTGYDPLLDCHYIMNHCRRCSARFSDSKLGFHPERIFGLNPAIQNRTVLQHVVGPVLAMGCIAPLDAGAVFAFSGSRLPFPAAPLATT
jgi:hypothetical protein